MFPRKFLMNGLGAMAVALALVMPAQGSAQEAVKIGAFDPDRVLSASQAGQQAIAQLNQLQNLRVTELQAQQAELSALQARMFAASVDSAAVLQRQFQDRQIQMERLQEDVQNEVQLRQQQLTQPIIAQIATIIDRIGSEESYTLIFNALQSGIVYVDVAVDLTDRIVQELDALAAAPGGN